MHKFSYICAKYLKKIRPPPPHVATLAWLQLGRVLTLPLILLLAFGLTLTEFLIRLREKSRWQP